jgi:hypothetical protein
MWETHRDMVPEIRALADTAEREGKPVARIRSLASLTDFVRKL